MCSSSNSYNNSSWASSEIRVLKYRKNVPGNPWKSFFWKRQLIFKEKTVFNHSKHCQNYRKGKANISRESLPLFKVANPSQETKKIKKFKIWALVQWMRRLDGYKYCCITLLHNALRLQLSITPASFQRFEKWCSVSSRYFSYLVLLPASEDPFLSNNIPLVRDRRDWSTLLLPPAQDSKLFLPS